MFVRKATLAVITQFLQKTKAAKATRSLSAFLLASGMMVLYMNCAKPGFDTTPVEQASQSSLSAGVSTTTLPASTTTLMPSTTTTLLPSTMTTLIPGTTTTLAVTTTTMRATTTTTVRASTTTTTVSVTTTTSPGATADFHPAGYQVLFADEFDGADLDRSKWCTRYGYGGGAALQIPDSACTGPGGSSGTLDFLNDEQERFVDTNRLNEKMHVLSGGTLKLRATKTRTTDTYASYEAAMIRSKLEFKPSATESYYATSRMKLPNVKGTWPAFWLNSGFGTNGKTGWPPEIDFLEGPLNGKDDTEFMIRQGSQVQGAQTASGKMEVTFHLPNFDTTWMNYSTPTTLRDVWVEIGAEWTNSAVCYFVNGVKTACENYKWVYNDGSAANPAHLLLNLAIGGGWAGRYGIDDTKFPTQMEIDYVHLYRKSN